MPKPMLRMTKKQATSGSKVPVAEVKAVKLIGKTTPPASASFYTADGKPDPAGLFDKDGYQVRMQAAAAPKVDPAKKKRADEEAARRAGFAK